ncbi:LCP family protein [Halobacillus salinarum]|uniref:LCP family protein n=1 Tax=Halobacillus salinarum TaxID=2932257 RepID=A0ABY4EMH0_9BACI|nr:LCP family protein [Halobacillus salinarum]UOQ45651.1 LCP family protein [Halobacillus salinarum]
MGRIEKNKQKRKKGKWWKILLLVLLLVLLAGGGYVYSIFHDVRSTVNTQLHKDVASIDTSVTKKKVKNKEPLHILLLGVDERQNDKGRSDTMIVLTLDPDHDQMQLVSIPRDTKTKIIGDGRITRINHSYAYGGSEMSVDTVENFLDVDLDYYVRVNMEGLSQLVDSVNGVTITNDRAFSQGGYNFPVGKQHLNGKQALSYVRMRKQDPQGDLGRNERQRKVITAIVDKGASLNMMNQIRDVMDVLGNNVTTNMEFSDMRRLAMNYGSARKQSSTYQMSGTGTMSNGMYLMVMSDSEVQKVHNMIVNFGK